MEIAVSDSVKTAPTPSLIGRWRRTTAPTGADKYPEVLTFSGGTYRGSRGPGQGMIVWDAGIYRFEGPHRLVVGTASDELVTYDVRLANDELQVTDAAGCSFAYRRDG